MHIKDSVYSSDSGGRVTQSEYVFDPKTGKFTPRASSSSVPSPQELGAIVLNRTNKEARESAKPTNTNPTSGVDSKTEAEKKFIEIELNTLEGELAIVPSKKSVRIKQGNTVEILGVGKYLSGKYFVSNVKRTLSRDGGYTQTLTVMKNGFGDSLKKPSDSDTSRAKAVDKSSHNFKVGDKVKIVGDAVYSNASEGVKVPEWVKQKTLTIQQISSDGTRVLLMPILSWTYVKYVQKV